MTYPEYWWDTLTRAMQKQLDEIANAAGVTHEQVAGFLLEQHLAALQADITPLVKWNRRREIAKLDAQAAVLAERRRALEE